MDFISELTGLQQLVQFTFTLTFIGMAAGALFFVLVKNSVKPEYEMGMILSAVILTIAAVNYFYMKEIYLMGIAADVPRFPTEFRYIDWFLTVPLMLVKFPVLLGFGRRAKVFMMILIVLSLIMLTSSFIGEINPDNDLLHFGGLAVGTLAWFAIIAQLLIGTSELPDSAPENTKKTIRKMVFFVAIGWAIYPIGYILPSLDMLPDYRELAYNVGDLLNKVGLALFVLAGSERK